MRKKWIRAAMLITAFSLLATGCGGNPSDSGNQNDSYEDYTPDKKPGGGQFDFDGNYVAPELTIDGKGDDEQWKNVPVLATFGHGNAATVKAYRGNDALFFFFEVEDTILLTDGNANDDSVTRSDSIEIYLDHACRRRLEAAERRLSDQPRHSRQDPYHAGLGQRLGKLERAYRLRGIPRRHPQRRRGGNR